MATLDPTTPQPRGGGIGAIFAALTGARGDRRQARRPVVRRRRRTRNRNHDGTEHPRTTRETPAPDERGTDRPGGRDGGDIPGRPGPRRTIEGAADPGSGPRRSPGSADGSRPGRRRVEAELIGLGDAGPAWWAPCWERGLDARLAPAQLFDDLGALCAGVRVLHDLGVAGTEAVIDHVLVGPGGVVVVGSVSCTGRVTTDGVHLRVRGRDRSPMIDVALWRAEVVRATLAQRGIPAVPVHGVLHWQTVEGLGNRAICLRGVPLLSAGAAVGLAARGGSLSPLAVERIVAALAP